MNNHELSKQVDNTLSNLRKTAVKKANECIDKNDTFRNSLKIRRKVYEYIIDLVDENFEGDDV